MFIWDFVASTVLNSIIDWVYDQVIGFLGNFFAVMGNMGVELFELEWVQYLHTLGNLTLTGYNSELGDLPFGKKKEKLQEVHTKVTRLNETVLSQEDWNEAAIAARAESLVRTIAALFPIEQPLVAISFADPQ